MINEDANPKSPAYLKSVSSAIAPNSAVSPNSPQSPVSPRKKLLKAAKTQFGGKKENSEDDISDSKKSADHLDLNLGIKSDSDNEDISNDLKQKITQRTSMKRRKSVQAETPPPKDRYLLTAKEEEYLSNYLKLNYFLEKQKIKHINAHENDQEETKEEDLQPEATLVNKLKDLDKAPIPRNVKYFYNSIELSSMDLGKKKKKAQLSLQNLSVKQNDVKILGNERTLKEDFKEMPESIDSVVKKIVKSKQLNSIQKSDQSTPMGDIIEEQTATGSKDDCRII